MAAVLGNNSLFDISFFSTFDDVINKFHNPWYDIYYIAHHQLPGQFCTLAMSNWGSGAQTPQSKEARCGLTFPASDLPLPYPCLSLPPLSLPRCRAGPAHLHFTASYWDVHCIMADLIAWLLSGLQEEDLFRFSINFMLLVLDQRWANSVFGTKYEYEYYSGS